MDRSYSYHPCTQHGSRVSPPPYSSPHFSVYSTVTESPSCYSIAIVAVWVCNYCPRKAQSVLQKIAQKMSCQNEQGWSLHRRTTPDTGIIFIPTSFFSYTDSTFSYVKLIRMLCSGSSLHIERERDSPLISFAMTNLVCHHLPGNRDVLGLKQKLIRKY